MMRVKKCGVHLGMEVVRMNKGEWKETYIQQLINHGVDKDLAYESFEAVPPCWYEDSDSVQYTKEKLSVQIT